MLCAAAHGWLVHSRVSSCCVHRYVAAKLPALQQRAYFTYFLAVARVVCRNVVMAVALYGYLCKKRPEMNVSNPHLQYKEAASRIFPKYASTLS